MNITHTRKTEVVVDGLNWEVNRRYMRLILRRNGYSYYLRIRWPWYAWKHTVSGNWLLQVRSGDGIWAFVQSKRCR